MLLDVIDVQYLNDYRLIITFENGEKRVVDLKNRLDGPIFEPLKEIDYFKQVSVDKELGTITWPNGADKAPDTLYLIGQPYIDSQLGLDHLLGQHSVSCESPSEPLFSSTIASAMLSS